MSNCPNGDSPLCHTPCETIQDVQCGLLLWLRPQQGEKNHSFVGNDVKYGNIAVFFNSLPAAAIKLKSDFFVCVREVRISI